MLTHRGKISTVAPTRLRLAGSGSPSSSSHSGGVRIPGTQPASPPPHRHGVPQGGLDEAPQPAGLPSPHNVLSVRSRVSLHLSRPGTPCHPYAQAPRPRRPGQQFVTIRHEIPSSAACHLPQSLCSQAHPRR